MLPLSRVTGMRNHLCPKISSTRPKRCTLLARFSLMLTSEPVTMPTDLECTDWLSVGYAVHLWLQPGPLWLLCKLIDPRSMSYWKWGLSTQEAANKWSLIWVATPRGPIMLFTLLYSNVVSFLSHFFFCSFFSQVPYLAASYFTKKRASGKGSLNNLPFHYKHTCSHSSEDEIVLDALHG